MLAINKLKRSQIALSEIGFGGAPLGNLYQSLDNATALQCVSTALANGINYFDTAPLYGHGLSERRIGLALNESNRESWCISSKVGRLLKACDLGDSADAGLYQQAPPFHAHYDYSYDGAWRSVEQSLQRLGCNYLDIVYIHDIDYWTHGTAQVNVYSEALNGANRALLEMREQGLIKALGLGVNEWQVCEQFLADSDPDCFLLAGRYTLLEQEALKSFLPACEQRAVDIIIGGPYNTGILATGAIAGAYYNYSPAREEILAKVRAMEAICNDFSVSLAAAALRFPLLHPAVASVIPGARSAKEVVNNLSLIQADIPSELWDTLKDKGLLQRDAPTQYPEALA